MPDEDLLRRVENAVIRGFRARSKFYLSMDLEDEQTLGPPASEQRIRLLEERLSLPLPPSYRAFLSLHDGWRMVAAETDLLSIDEMLAGPYAEKVRRWQEQAAKWGDEPGGSGLVIGFSMISQSRIILDPARADATGEWMLVEKYKDEEVEYRSFVEWLEKSAVDFEVIAEPDNE